MILPKMVTQALINLIGLRPDQGNSAGLKGLEGAVAVSIGVVQTALGWALWISVPALLFDPSCLI